ncbi:hypothetical protein G3479_19700 [Shewanella baltica]|uniref:hypothetical protein n=1 Tax=Shewanella baltica TaxID=62322 RepID=UPI00217EA285|nr:hypothetical protein [Shewanella baltica]MCS6261429.1 hypothetical protein [Shewanella baltica]
MYKYFPLITMLLTGCASKSEIADSSWCESYNEKLATIFKNETTVGAKTLDTLIGCAPRPLPLYLKGSTLNDSKLVSNEQINTVNTIKSEYKNSTPKADDIINFATSKEAKQLALSRALRLNELAYSIAEQSQKNKSSLIRNDTFAMLNSFTLNNIKWLNEAADEESYDRYQKKVHRIQREYYKILYQITLGGADKNGGNSIKYDTKDISSLLIKVLKLYADQQAVKSNFLLMRDQYFVTISNENIPSFEKNWNNQLKDIKKQCEISAKELNLDKKNQDKCKKLLN